MARPTVPLISREKVCEVALEMIDADGIDALTIRGIASRLNVNGASLYHHFRNKEEIIAGAAELALMDAQTPRVGDEGWKSWSLRNVLRLRSVLRKHPDLIPTLLRRRTLHIAMKETEFYFAEFEKYGLPIGLAWTLMESLQAYAIGVVMHENGSDALDAQEMAAYPAIARAAEQRLLNRDEEFQIGCTGLIDAIERAANPVPVNERGGAGNRQDRPSKGPVRSRQTRKALAGPEETLAS